MKKESPAAAAAAMSPSASAVNKVLMKKIMTSYYYVVIWITLSSAVVVCNKYILDPKMLGWTFPISLAIIHMAFCSVLAFLLVRVVRVVDLPSSPPMSFDLYVSSIIPIGALYSLSLWFSNSAYIYLSVSFIQMLKALMPAAFYFLSVLFNNETFNFTSADDLLIISAGVAVFAYGEARFHAWGVALQLSAVTIEAARRLLIQILLTSNGIKFNPIVSLYYVAPCCLLFLIVPWIAIEAPMLMRYSASLTLGNLLLFGMNALCVFALNPAVFLLVGKTSLLTTNVAGIVRDWLLIGFSWYVIRDTVTTTNLIGYGISFSGAAYYSYLLLHAMKARWCEG